MLHFPKMHGLAIVSLCLIAPTGRASAIVLLDDFHPAPTSTAVDIVRKAAALTGAASSSLGGETPIGGSDDAQIALADPPIEIAGQRWTEFSDAADEPVVEVYSLDYKVFGVP
jgi:hypothetical protein